MFLRGQKSLTQRRAQYYNVVDTNTDGGRGAVIRQVWFLEGFTMSIQNEYLSGLMERVVRRNPAEPEFHQAVPGGLRGEPAMKHIDRRQIQTIFHYRQKKPSQRTGPVW